MLQAVRCERCYHRSYALRTIAVLERDQNERKDPQSQRPGGSNSSNGASGNRVA